MTARENDEEIDIDAEMARDGWTRVQGRISKTPRAVFAIRLSPEEMEAFTAAAKARQMTLADFLRSSARAAIAGEVDPEKAAAAEVVREKVRELADAASRL